MIMFCVLLYLTASIRNTLMGYVVFSLYIMLGLAMVIRFIWRRIFMMHEGNVQKRLDELESGLLGLKSYVVITFFVGLGLIAISIQAMIWLSRGSLFD